jgi:hypothetical protein
MKNLTRGIFVLRRVSGRSPAQQNLPSNPPSPAQCFNTKWEGDWYNVLGVGQAAAAQARLRGWVEESPGSTGLSAR